MKEKPTLKKMNRRDFLKASALTAGMVMAGPVAGYAAARKFKVGVLLAESTLYPNLGANFEAGLNLYFHRNGWCAGGQRICLIVRSAGTRRADVLTAVEALLDKKCRMIVALAGRTAAGHLAQRLAGENIALIVNNASANRPSGAEFPEFVFFNSLNCWQAAWALGNWAADGIGPRAAVLSSFYDAGYDMPFLFQQGFEAAGGHIVYRQVGGAPAHTGVSASAALAEAVAAGPDLIAGFYCGNPAIKFLADYAAHGLNGHIPLIGPGLLAGDGTLAEAGAPAMGTLSCFSWAAGLDNSENGSFVRDFERQTGRAADGLAVLGYESGFLIKYAISATSGNWQDTASILFALGNAEFTGPRGAVWMSPQTRRMQSPLYLREVVPQKRRLINCVIKELANPHLEIGLPGSALQSGWLNMYLGA